MKRWLKLEILPLILLLALHAQVFSVADLTPLQVVVAAAVFLVIPALVGAFYGYTVGRADGVRQANNPVHWEVVDTSKGGA